VPYLHRKSSGTIVAGGTGETFMLGYSGTF